jgi:hypothetical protein
MRFSHLLPRQQLLISKWRVAHLLQLSRRLQLAWPSLALSAELMAGGQHAWKQVCAWDEAFERIRPHCDRQETS